MTPEYTRAEERANVASAAAGLIAFLAVSPFLTLTASRSGAPILVAGAVVFSLSVVLLYLSSTFYHALPAGSGRRVVRLFDHSAIFVLIAGTYTPFALGPLWEHGGWVILVVEWTLAVLGIAFKVLGGIRLKALSLLIYLGMGWLGIFWVKPFIQSITWPGFLWVLAGGACYTVGVAFYAAKGRPYAHFIWHLFVFAGTSCHTYAIWRYVL